jgi:alanyl-tRNA synthetase
VGLNPLPSERIYYLDSYLTDFNATVIDTAEDERRVYLDRTAFYPSSGGQPHDIGTIGGVAVLDVIDEEDRIAHITAAPVSRGEVCCRIDWARRFDHMQQHSGQHLLSAVVLDMLGGATVSFHLGADVSTIDVALPALDARQAAAVEQRVNELVMENRPVAVSFEENSAELGLRKPSGREGLLRIVSIEGVDRSACGGTHVRGTAEIGPILLRKLDKAHGSVRIEFLCGFRAIRRARADYETLAKLGRLFSSAPDEIPALAASQLQALDASEKARRRLVAELARLQGGELFRVTEPNAAGVRTVVQTLCKGATLDDEVRACAQGFTAAGKAVFLAVVEDPPALLLAASADAGVHAGNAVKSAVTAFGGRGGGNAQLAQGSLPSREALAGAVSQLKAAW